MPSTDLPGGCYVCHVAELCARIALLCCCRLDASEQLPIRVRHLMTLKATLFMSSFRQQPHLSLSSQATKLAVLLQVGCIRAAAYQSEAFLNGYISLSTFQSGTCPMSHVPDISDMLLQVGCIRAAAYQSEAFLNARMEAFQQQGLSQGNVPAAAGDSHQVYTTTQTDYSLFNVLFSCMFVS